MFRICICIWRRKAFFDEKYVSKVSWIERATIRNRKKDGSEMSIAPGAVFGVYSDEACTKLITQMPATDKNGKSSVTIIKTQDTVYLKEITAPQGYMKCNGNKCKTGSK